MKETTTDAVLGDVIEPPRSPVTSVAVELSARPLRKNWKRCGLTADWLSSYFAADLPPTTRAQTKSTLSTVLNELVENAAKFSVNEHDSIGIQVRHCENLFRIEISNTAASSSVRLLEQTIDELARNPSEDVFTQRIGNANLPGTPGIGLLIIQRDYGARVTASLTPRPEGTHDVRVTVELEVARS